MIETILKFLKIPYDKALHIIYGVVLFSVLHFIDPFIALVAVLLIGIIKEVYDRFNKTKHTPDVYDAVATFIGGLIGFICYLKI